MLTQTQIAPTKILSTTVLAVDPGVIHTELTEGESVLLHLKTNHYYTLNQTGSAIWKLIGKQMSLGEICRAMEATYLVSHEDMRHSTLELVDDFLKEKLVAIV